VSIHIYSVHYLIKFNQYILKISLRSKIITHNKKISPDNNAAVNYYRSMTSYIEQLRTLHSSLRRKIK